MKRSESGVSPADKRKNKIRFGAADLVIILLVLISVASIVVRSVSDNAAFRSKTENCTVQFLAEEVRYTTFDLLEPGTDVYLDDELIGKLATGVSYSPSVLHASGADGTPIDVHYRENTLIDISGMLECALVSTDGGFVTPGGVHLAPGCVITLKLRTVDLHVTITGVAVQETR